MSRFHINKHGVPAPCKAEHGKCPLGDNSEHFSSQEEAQNYIDDKFVSEFGLLGDVNRPSEPQTLNEKLSKVFNQKDVEILNKLDEAGFEAYFVGGSLRDAVIGLPINDVDITTSATPEEVIQVFSDYNVLPIGIEHGTVVVMYEDEQVEITTFRQDGEYSDGRRPDAVYFTKSLEEDIARRDFTINSLAYNPKEGLVDFVGGIEDINNRVIKAVGDPDKRFQEDPLRIMRGLRFASKLGFDIENKTESSIFKNKGLLKNVSAERLQVEFNGLLMGKNSKEVLTKYSSVISEFIPEIKPMIGFDQKNPHHLYDVWEHSAAVVENAENDVVHKLAAVFHDSGKPATFTIDDKGVGHFLGHADESVKIAEQALTRLRYDNKTKQRVLNLISGHDENLSTKKYKIGKAIYEYGPERYLDTLRFIRADDKGKNLSYSNRFNTIDKIENMAKEYLKNEPILTRKDLAIEPKDIIDLGFKGKEIGDMLDKLALLVISGHKNERESQINYLIKNEVKQRG